MSSHNYCEACNLEGTTLFVATRLLDEERLCPQHLELVESEPNATLAGRPEDTPKKTGSNLISQDEAWALVGGVGFGIIFHQYLGEWAWVMFVAPLALSVMIQVVHRINAVAGDDDE